MLDDLGGGSDLGDDLIHGLVGHGRLVQSLLHDGGGVDAGHLGAVFVQRELSEGLFAAHQTPRAVGGGAVPVGVAPADADEAAVPHIDGDQQLFALFGRDRALAQDHRVGVDVVVDGGELFRRGQPQTGEDDVGHGPAIEHGEALHDAHIVDVVLEQLPFHPGQVAGYGGGLFPLLLQLFDGIVDLFMAALGLQFFDGLIDLEAGAAGKRAVALVLVVFADLLAQIAAAGVDHQEQLAPVVSVQFDEVVAAAQGADTAAGPEQVHERRAAQLVQVDLRVIGVVFPADLLPAGYQAADQVVQGVEVDMAFLQPHGLHAAADVHAHHTGHYFVADGHGGADGAAHAGVYVGHDADAAAGEGLLVADGLDLAGGGGLQLVGEAAGGVVQSFYFDQFDHSFLYNRGEAVFPTALPGRRRAGS